MLAIFASRLLNGHPPLIFEDGRQQRDFVNVRDVARACRLALEQPAERVNGRAFNVGGGQACRVEEIAQLLASVLGIDIEPERTGRYRVGDIRHCVADRRMAERYLAVYRALGNRSASADAHGRRGAPLQEQIEERMIVQTRRVAVCGS